MPESQSDSKSESEVPLITADFTIGELQLLSDALHFTAICMDGDSVSTYIKMSMLRDKVERLLMVATEEAAAVQ
jgi:hypothetical protein